MITQLRLMRAVWLWLAMVLSIQYGSAKEGIRQVHDGSGNSKATHNQDFRKSLSRKSAPVSWASQQNTGLAPVITVSSSSLTVLNSTQLPGSNPTSYTVSAMGLTSSDFRVTVPAPFIVSAMNAGPFENSITLPVNPNGTVDPTVITVALLSSSPGAFTGTISNISGSTTATVAVSGTTVSPTLSVSPTALSNFTATTGTPSAVQTYTITALSQTGGSVLAPTGVELRTGNDSFGSSLTIPGSLSAIRIPVDVRLTGTTAGPVSGLITHRLNNSSNQSIAEVAVTGSVADPVQARITVSPSSLTVVDYSEYPGSFPASYTVSASGLTNDLLITAPHPYWVSALDKSGPSVLVPATNGVVPPTPVRVLLLASSPGTFTGVVTNSSGSLTTNVPVSGTALAQSVSVNPASLGNFTTTVGTPSASQSYTVTTRGGLPVHVNAPAGFEIRTGNDPFGSSLVIGTSPLSVNTSIDVRLTGATAGPVSGTITQNTYFHASHGIYPLEVSGFVTVGTPMVQVLHRDVDNYADNNAIQPLLQIQNQGAGPLPLSRLTLRYYVTVENGGSLGNLSLNYAQVGNQNVRLRYVPLSPAQQGATGYVEYSFTEGAGNLAAGANSGPIQTYFTKSDYGPLNELDDYSYNPVRNQLTGNLRITAYYDGVLIAGLEPGSTTQIRAVRALTESKNGPSATQINTYVEVRNEGNVAINYSDLKVRYYFTSDGNERLQVEVDEGNVSTQLVKLSTPLAGADTYLELSFNQSGQLAAGTSTGTIRYRISKPDDGRFNQANDYSYQEQPQDRSQNSRVVVYAGSERVWGQEPNGSARMAFTELGTSLSVKVLGNPIQNEKVSFEVAGVEGQALQLQLLTPQGRVVNQRQVPGAGPTQRHEFSVAGQAGGLFLLQVNTPTQSQTVKVLKAE